MDKRKNAGRRYFYNDAGEQKYLPLLGICTTDGDYLVGTVPNFVLKNFVKQIPESVSGQELNKLREVGFAIQEEDNLVFSSINSGVKFDGTDEQY